MVIVTLSSYLFLLFGDLVSFHRKKLLFLCTQYVAYVINFMHVSTCKRNSFEASTERDEKVWRLGTSSLRGEYLDRLHFKRFVIEIVSRSKAFGYHCFPFARMINKKNKREELP